MGEMIRPTRRFGAIGTVVVLAAMLLTGCSGSSLHADFRAAFAGDDAVAGFELSTADNMPFTDGLSADVRARHTASADELRALADRLSGFARDHAGDEVRITVEAEDVTVPVFADAAISADTMTSALDLRDDDRVDSVAFTTSAGQQRVTGASLHLAEGGVERAIAAFDLARSVPVMLDDVAGGSSLHLTIRADEAVKIDGIAGTWIDDVERAWTAVSSAVPTTGLRAEPGRVEVMLATETDLDTARALSETVTDDLVIVFASPLVALGANASGNSVRALLHALEPANVTGVRSVWTDDERAELFADSVEQADALAAASSSLPEAEVFAMLSVTVGSPDAPLLSVTAVPARLGDAVEAAGKVLASQDVGSVVSSPRSTTLVLVGDASDAELERRLPTLSGLAEEGARVCANRSDGTGVCVTAAP
jgi:hypothetical protein